MSNTKSISEYIHVVIVFCLMFLFRFLPACEPITPYGMAVLGVFLGCVWGWCFCGNGWPSLLALVALGLTDMGSTYTVIGTVFGNANLIVCLLSFIIMVPVVTSGVAEWMGMKLLTSKLVKGKPYVLMTGLYFGALIIGQFINALVLEIFLLQLFVDIFKKLGYKPGDLFVSIFIVGYIFMPFCFGTIWLSFHSIPLYAYSIAAASGIALSSSFNYMIFVLAIAAVYFVVFTLIVKLLPLDVERLAQADFGNSVQELDKRQKAIFYVVILFVVLLLTTGLLGKTGAGSFRHVLGLISIYGATVLTLVAEILVRVDGKPILDINKANVSFDFIFLLGIALSMSSIIVSDGTGIAPFVINLVTPILSGTGEYIFLLLLAVITIVLSNVANNTVIIMTMTSVVVMMVNAGMDINGALAIAIVIMSGQCSGFALPSASLAGAMMYGCELTDAKSCIAQAAVAIVVLLLIMAVFAIPLGRLLL